MDYRETAKELLAKKIELQNAYAALTDEINMLESEKYSVKSVVGDTSVAKGGGSKYEEYITNLIYIYDNTDFRRKVVRRQLDMIEKGFSVLSEYEQDVLEVFFVQKKKYAPDILSGRWYKERSAVYTDRNVALNKFTRAVYGVLHL